MMLATLALCTSSALAGAQTVAHKSWSSCSQALQLPSIASPEELPSPLRLKSWNIMKFDLPGSQAELQRLSHDAHIVFLQESLRGATKALKTLTYRYFSPGYARGSEATGVEIRSQSPADVVCELKFKEPWLRTPKAVSVARLPFRQGPLLLINLHAINFTLTSKDYRDNLAEFSQFVSLHQGPVIVAGDFNHWNVWRARALQSWADNLGLSEVRFELDWRSRHVGSAVDTIFVRGLKVVARAAFPTIHSDHHAIAASLVLATRPSDSMAGSLAVSDEPTPKH